MSHDAYACTAQHHIPIHENAYIFEKNVSETLRWDDIEVRIRHFTEWLLELNAEILCVVVVGHSGIKH